MYLILNRLKDPVSEEVWWSVEVGTSMWRKCGRSYGEEYSINMIKTHMQV